MSGIKRVALLALAVVGLLPATAFAQGSIAGVVRDSSGAVLPGVTVEASSAALIEKVRSVVTDGAGQYRIVDLRPGTYTVTFSLAGFSSVKREGLELTGSFVATVSTQMAVGSVSETINVSGQAPVVDVQTTSQQRVLDAETIAALPAGRSHYDLAILVPGLTGIQFGRAGFQDVGGTNNLQIAALSIHGGSFTETRLMVNGLTSRNLLASAWASNFIPDTGTAAEMAINYSSLGAESPTGGVTFNMIPKEGGNRFNGSLFATGANESFQGSNYTPALQQAGLAAPNALYRMYDVNPSGGGPIMRDKLWFYVSGRWQTNQTYVAGSFGNKNAGDAARWDYVADPSVRGKFNTTQNSGSVRLTWQASPRNKFSFSHDPQNRHWIDGRAGVSPESFTDYRFTIQRFTSATYTSPVTNRLLVEAKWADHGEEFEDWLPPSGDPFASLITVQDLGALNLIYRGKGHGGNQASSFGLTSMPNIQQVQTSLSFITGTHRFKAGFQDEWGANTGSQRDIPSGLHYQFIDGVPFQVTQRALPTTTVNKLDHEMGIYAQDTWTIRRLTVNGGVRFDYFKTSFPVQTIGPGAFVPNRNLTFPATDFYSMKDITPRVGASYDLLGDGSTALKIAWGKYMTGIGPGAGNPIGNLATLATRQWRDANRNFVPDCNLNDLSANAQDNTATGGDFCGPISNRNFGLNSPSARVDPDTYTGWGNRAWNQEFSVSVQRQIVPRVGLDIGYFRRWFGNFTTVDNELVTAADFTSYSVAAPSDSRLPDGGGQVISGFYDLNPNKIGQVNTITTLAKKFGKQWQHWNGVDVTVNARPGSGVVVQGGVSTGRTTSDSCALRSALPEIATLNPYCHVEQDFQTQVKFLGSYLIPRVDVQFAATLQSSVGPEIQAFHNAPVSTISGLGRPLSSGATTVRVNLIPTSTIYGERSNQLDLRMSKIFRMSSARVSVNFDLANLLNSNDVLGLNTNFGTTWLAPRGIIDPRLFKFGVQFDF